jgi:hypothetical protein
MCNHCQKFWEFTHPEDKKKLERMTEAIARAGGQQEAGDESAYEFPHPGLDIRMSDRVAMRPQRRPEDTIARAWDKVYGQNKPEATIPGTAPEKPTIEGMLGYQEQVIEMAEHRFRQLRNRLTLALPLTDEAGGEDSRAIGPDTSPAMARIMQHNDRIERLMRAMERLEYDIQL